jgi:hypothetical protein
LFLRSLHGVLQANLHALHVVSATFAVLSGDKPRAALLLGAGDVVSTSVLLRASDDVLSNPMLPDAVLSD